MIAEIWKIYVCDGVLSALHGGFYPVVELFIPKLNFTVSSKSYFDSAQSRYSACPDKRLSNAPEPEKIGEIELTESEFQILTQLKNADNDYKSFIDSVKKRLPEFVSNFGN